MGLLCWTEQEMSPDQNTATARMTEPQTTHGRWKSKPHSQPRLLSLTQQLGKLNLFSDQLKQWCENWNVEYFRKWPLTWTMERIFHVLCICNIKIMPLAFLGPVFCSAVSSFFTLILKCCPFLNVGFPQFCFLLFLSCPFRYKTKILYFRHLNPKPLIKFMKI